MSEYFFVIVSIYRFSRGWIHFQFYFIYVTLSVLTIHFI